MKNSPAEEIRKLCEKFYYEEIERLQKLVLDGHYTNKQGKLEEEVANLERWFKLSKEMLKELNEDSHSNPTSFVPLDYLTSEEKFIYRSVKQDIKRCKELADIELLERKLDTLLERAIVRYRKDRSST